MKEAEKASFCGFKNQPSFAEINNFYLPPLSDIPDQDQSPPLMERERRIQSVYNGPLRQPAPVPRLQESPSTSNRDERKIDSKCKCPDCGKGFKTNKAMFGHMRIHRDRGLKGFKRPSVSKGRSESTLDHDSYTDRLLSNSWGATRKRGSKPALDKNSPEVVAAFTLIQLSRSNSSYQNKKTRTMESDPLDDKKHVCEKCNKSFPSHQALVEHCSSHKKARRNVAIREPSEQKTGEIHAVSAKRKRKVKSRSHKCELCGASYPKGQQLGGHKRAHYKKEPIIISEVPDVVEAALDSF